MIGKDGVAEVKLKERAIYLSFIVVLLMVLGWPWIRHRIQATPFSIQERFEIKDVIQSIHTQLIQSQKEREEAGRSPLFVVKSFDLELQAIITQENKASGKAEVKVLALGREDSINRERTTKITLHMEALGFGAAGTPGRAYALPKTKIGRVTPSKVGKVTTPRIDCGPASVLPDGSMPCGSQ